MEQRLSLITLGVRDLQRARSFYEQGLGWKPAEMGGEGIAFYSLGSIALALFPREELAKDANLADAGDPDRFGGVAVAYNVRSREEVDAVLAQATGVGATLLKTGQDAFWGGYSGYFADPDGHPWEVCFNPYVELGPAGEFRVE